MVRQNRAGNCGFAFHHRDDLEERDRWGINQKLTLFRLVYPVDPERGQVKLLREFSRTAGSRSAHGCGERPPSSVGLLCAALPAAGRIHNPERHRFSWPKFLARSGVRSSAARESSHPDCLSERIEILCGVLCFLENLIKFLDSVVGVWRNGFDVFLNEKPRTAEGLNARGLFF